MKPSTITHRETITGIILAGGQGRRLGNRDKGLLTLAGRSVIETVLTRLAPQVEQLVISANRNLGRYRQLGHPVVQDTRGAYLGPLAGIAAAARAADTPLLLVVPCDAPRLPADLAERLRAALIQQDLDVCVAHDGERLQPVFMLLRRGCGGSLAAYLDGGGRKVREWVAQQRWASVDFSDCPGCFFNINTEDDLANLQIDSHAAPPAGH